ncbi:hypothetical protein A9986_13315 [Solibacillus silvestris]|nr:hypothetical protein [Solibacillus silvestris]OBW54606.1 hypothetical protein A9986_13315 [Solibacillus silvestris]
MAKISQESIDLIRNVPMVEVAHALGLPMKQIGKQIFIPCPNPDHAEGAMEHCCIETRKNIMKCFTCTDTSANNAIGFYAWHKFGKSDGVFKQSIQGIAELLKIEIYDETGKVIVAGNKDYVPSVKVVSESLPPQEPRILDAVYRAFLNLCPLRTEHHKELLERGYRQDELNLYMFRSVPTYDEWLPIYKTLMEKNYPLERVPGFSQIFQPDYYKQSKFPAHLGEAGEISTEKGVVKGKWHYVCTSMKGYFIPVFDEYGYIIRLRIRKDEGSPKYIWFSSQHNVESETNIKYLRRNGASSGAPMSIAVPPAVMKVWSKGRHITEVCPMKSLLVTEGEHKAYISSKTFGLLVVGLPGAGNYEEFLMRLQEWKYVKKLITAYDMDTCVLF